MTNFPRNEVNGQVIDLAWRLVTSHISKMFESQGSLKSTCNFVILLFCYFVNFVIFNVVPLICIALSSISGGIFILVISISVPFSSITVLFGNFCLKIELLYFKRLIVVFPEISFCCFDMICTEEVGRDFLMSIKYISCTRRQICSNGRFPLRKSFLIFPKQFSNGKAVKIRKRTSHILHVICQMNKIMHISYETRFTV